MNIIKFKLNPCIENLYSKSRKVVYSMKNFDNTVSLFVKYILILIHEDFDCR